MTGYERSGWRDEGLSRRHRTWGFDVPAVDIDFLMLEYDQKKAVALIEYKHENAASVSPSEPSIMAVRDLADLAGVYFFVVRYAGDFAWFRVRALNPKASGRYPSALHLTETQYVEFLHRLRSEKTCKHDVKESKCGVCSGRVRAMIAKTA